MPRLSFLLRIVSLLGGLLFVTPARAESSTNGLGFNDFLVAGLRVHLLSSTNVALINTTLNQADITHILARLNEIWSQAGLHFYPASVTREDALNSEFYTEPAKADDQSTLLNLRPSLTDPGHEFHVYYIKKMVMNGIYFPEAIFVKDTAALRPVEGGIDEPLPRVTSHELGHALGLPHRQSVTNLMASGTTGTWLNQAEIDKVRKKAQTSDRFEPASEVMKRADLLFAANKRKEATELYSRLATIPLSSAQIALARERSTE
jgi:hypothetical protein